MPSDRVDFRKPLPVPGMTGLGTCLGMSNVLWTRLGVSNVLRLGMSPLPGLLMTRLRMDDMVPLGMWLRMRHGFRLRSVLCRDRSAAVRCHLFHRRRSIVLGNRVQAGLRPGFGHGISWTVPRRARSWYSGVVFPQPMDCRACGRLP